MKIWKQLLIGFLSSLYPTAGLSQQGFVINDSLLEESIPPALIGVLPDMAGQYTVEQAYAHEGFIVGHTHMPVMAGRSQIAWVRLTVTNTTSFNKLLLEYGVPLVEHIEYYSKVDSGVFIPQQVTGVQRTSQKKYHSTQFYFDLDIPRGQTKTVLLKLQSDEPLRFSFRVVPLGYLHGNEVRWRHFLHGAFVGVMLIMLVYNLLIFINTGYRVYGLYVTYLLFEAFTQFGIMGLYQNYFPLFGQVNNGISYHWLLILIALSGTYFFETFTRMRELVPVSRYLLNLIYGLYILATVVLLSGYTAHLYVFLEANAILCSVVFLSMFTYIGYIKKQRKGRVLLYSFSIFFMGNVLYALRDYGFIPNNSFTYSTIAVGAALQTFIFSLALGDEIKTLRRQKDESQTVTTKMKKAYEDLQLELKGIQLNALQQQMNPHFVSNALNSVQRALIKGGQPEARNLVSLFSRVMRTSLHHSRVESISLAKEVQFINDYLHIEQKRFPKRFTFSIDVNDELLDENQVAIPPLMVQPLCENVIKHAFTSKVEQPHINLTFERLGTEAISCCIEDNGVGLEASAVQKGDKTNHTSMGLDIIRQRIDLLKAQKLTAGFSISAGTNGVGTMVHLILPNYAI